LSALAGYAAQEPTHAPPWHGLVVWDMFFNALATGLFLTAAVGELAKPAVFAPVGVWAYPLALLLLLIDLTLLVLDLGDPLRFHHMLRVFKPSSPMSLGTWCLTAFALALTAVVALDALVLVAAVPGESRAVGTVRLVFLVAALPFCFGSMAYKGVLFSTSAQPGWKDARWLGSYHVASAFALGAAVLLALAMLVGAEPAANFLRRAVAVLVVLQLVPLLLLATELRRTLGGGGNRRQRLIAIVLAIGMVVVVPVALLLIDQVPPLVRLAAVIVVLGSGWSARDTVVRLPHHEQHAETAPALHKPTGA
jgi:hypothetical protein